MSITADIVKFQLEIPLNSSKGVLYNCISTPSGLAEWFCDDVNIKKDVHIFFWDGSEESARLVSKKKTNSSNSGGSRLKKKGSTPSSN